MEINLKIDYKGNPYIDCSTGSGKNIENDLMEIFIRKVKSEGLIIINESCFENIDDYISIRLAKSNNLDGNDKKKIIIPDKEQL